MKNQRYIPLAFLALVLASLSIAFTSENGKKAVVRHVVSFQFKEEVSEERRAQAIRDFLDLQNRIPEIKQFEGGENISEEGHDKGFTHCYVLTFEDEAGRNAYLPHPAHLEVAKKNKPLMKDLFVVDYWGEE